MSRGESGLPILVIASFPEFVYLLFLFGPGGIGGRKKEKKDNHIEAEVRKQ